MEKDKRYFMYASLTSVMGSICTVVSGYDVAEPLAENNVKDLLGLDFLGDPEPPPENTNGGAFRSAAGLSALASDAVRIGVHADHDGKKIPKLITDRPVKASSAPLILTGVFLAAAGYASDRDLEVVLGGTIIASHMIRMFGKENLNLPKAKNAFQAAANIVRQPEKLATTISLSGMSIGVADAIQNNDMWRLGALGFVTISLICMAYVRRGRMEKAEQMPDTLPPAAPS